jgi:hypothetical protein
LKHSPSSLAKNSPTDSRITSQDPGPEINVMQDAHISASAPLDPQIIADTADYIAKMSAELVSLAQSAKLELLAYFLDMARMEAISEVRERDLKQKP